MSRSTTPAWRNLRLGVFFLTGLAVLITSLFIVGTNQQLFRRKFDLNLYLDNAQGLSKGALVALSGLEVGRVSALDFVEHEGANMVEVRMSVERRFRNRITASSMATIRTVGVLGDKFIDISLGDAAETPLAPGATLTVRGQIDWAATFERGVQALDDFIVLLDDASETVARINRGEGTVGMLLSDSTTADRFRVLTGNLASVSSRLRSGDGTLGRLLADPAVAERLESVLDRLDAVTREAGEGDGLMARLLSDEALAAEVDSLVRGSRGLVEAVGSGGTTGRLIEDETLYEEFRTSLQELRTLVEDMRLNPGRYVRVSIF